MIRSCLVASLALGLSACSIWPNPAPPNVTYRLSQSVASVQPNAEATVIRVDRPAATSVFNTRSIVVSPDGRRLSTAAQAEWAESIPAMIQQSLVDAFSKTPNIIGVLPESGTRTDTRIHLTIQNFEAQFDQGETVAPLAIVSYAVTLANANDRKLIATFNTKQTSRASAARVSAIVEALDASNSKALEEIAAWIEEIDSQGMIGS